MPVDKVFGGVRRFVDLTPNFNSVSSQYLLVINQSKSLPLIHIREFDLFSLRTKHFYTEYSINSPKRVSPLKTQNRGQCRHCGSASPRYNARQIGEKTKFRGFKYYTKPLYITDKLYFEMRARLYNLHLALTPKIPASFTMSRHM